MAKHFLLREDPWNGKVIGRGHRKGELFVLDFNTHSTSPTCFLAPSSTNINSANKLWRLCHYRLGHPHALNLDSLFFSAVLDKFDNKAEINKTCEDCALAKARTLPFIRSTNHSSNALSNSF
ncbi:gag_pre-integrs domain-containing protein [Cephalotus follicularis]|uniref:Gag_pre-integrs domain-containing protein n=1 Tax=Cephalotus follicularis TaxID=3775 RepID=A0A1Q3BW95_CEPFO|nr:gag_pre-integrs domain-containing protein [Cephalotus follicularis]